MMKGESDQTSDLRDQTSDPDPEVQTGVRSAYGVQALACPQAPELWRS